MYGYSYQYGRIIGKGGNPAAAIFGTYKSRVLADGGVVENDACAIAFLESIGAGIIPSFDADAQAFFDRVTAASGSLTTTEQDAVNTLVVQMKADGIWDSMKAIYPMVGASAAACSQNLKSSSFTGSFSSGWTFASTGVTGNGTSTFMNTNFNAQALGGFVNDYSMFMYTRTLGTNDAGNGITTAGGRTDLLDFSGKRYWTCGLSATQVDSGTKWIGLSLGSRISSTSNKSYRNNTNTYSNNTLNTSTSFSNNPLFMGSLTGYSLFSNYQYALFGMGNGLTDTQASNFYTAVQAFQTTLSRQV